MQTPGTLPIRISFACATPCGLNRVLQQVAKNNRQIDRLGKVVHWSLDS